MPESRDPDADHRSPSHAPDLTTAFSNPPAERVLVITGGAGDLASAICAAFQKSGWTILAPGHRELDVTRPREVAQWFEDRAPVRIDLLINNAGIRRDQLFGRLQEEDWDAVLETCLRGAMLCAREAARRMLPAGRGHIVNIGSLSARGVAGQSAYAAAKAGLAALTRSLAAEWGPRNIRVNAILPGWLQTRFTADVPAGRIEEVRTSHVLGRFNTPQEAARFIVFLESMPHVSGQVFQLDSRISPG